MLAAPLLKAGADVNLASLEGVTPLMAASYGGHVLLARRLLDASALTAPIDRMKKPAIVYAAGQGHVDVLVLLLNRGVPIDGAYENDLTALMWAAGQGHAGAVKLLLSRRADRALRDARGLTAAQIALQAGYADLAALLTAP